MLFLDAGDRQRRGENRTKSDEIKKKSLVSKESKVVMPKDVEALRITVKEDTMALLKDAVMIERQPTLP